jgi:hypothetical protein
MKGTTIGNYFIYVGNSVFSRRQQHNLQDVTVYQYKPEVKYGTTIAGKYYNSVVRIACESGEIVDSGRKDGLPPEVMAEVKKHITVPPTPAE